MIGHYSRNMESSEDTQAYSDLMRSIAEAAWRLAVVNHRPYSAAGLRSSSSEVTHGFVEGSTAAGHPVRAHGIEFGELRRKPSPPTEQQSTAMSPWEIQTSGYAQLEHSIDPPDPLDVTVTNHRMRSHVFGRGDDVAQANATSKATRQIRRARIGLVFECRSCAAAATAHWTLATRQPRCGDSVQGNTRHLVSSWAVHVGAAQSRATHPTSSIGCDDAALHRRQSASLHD